MKLLDTKIRLGLPYNHDPNYPEWLASRLEGVCEVYFPVHRSISESSHSWKGPNDPADYAEDLGRLAAVLNPARIDANILFNLNVDPSRWQDAADELTRLSRVFDRLVVTLAEFDFGCWLHRQLPELRKTVSTVAMVRTPVQAAQWKAAAGIESVTLVREINKSPETIKAIRDLGLKIRMVLDDACLPNCPGIVSHMSRMYNATGEDFCCVGDIRDQSPWLVAQKDVVPGTLPRYDGIVDIAKIEGRGRLLSFIEEKRRVYLEAESWAHPSELYIEPPDAFDKITTCDRDCVSCGWCERHFEYPPPAARREAGAPTSAGKGLGLTGSPEADDETLSVAVAFGDQACNPCVLDIRSLDVHPTPFRAGLRLGLTFRGRDEEIDDACWESMVAAADQIMRLESEQADCTPRRLLEAIASSDLREPGPDRPWWIQLE